MKLVSTRNLTALVAVGCLSLVALLLAGRDLPAAFAKLAASSGFIWLAIHAGGLRSKYGRVIVAGLAFSWLGDAALIGDSRSWFLFGLGAFLLAHVAYIGAFLIAGLSARWVGIAAIPIAIIALAVSEWLDPYLGPGLVVPVRLYIVVISLMVITAFGARGRGATLFIVVGAVSFFLSDLSVAALRLVQTDIPTYVVGLPLYYFAQINFALSTARNRDPTEAFRKNGPPGNR